MPIHAEGPPRLAAEPGKGSATHRARAQGGAGGASLAAEPGKSSATPHATGSSTSHATGSAPPRAAGSATPHAAALTHLVTGALADRKAQRVTMLDVHDLTDVTDVMVIASGRSPRHVKAAAEHVVEKTKAAGCRPLGVEGLREGEWVLVDLGDLVLHVMTPETRETYQLEKLWGGAARKRVSPGSGSP